MTTKYYCETEKEWRQGELLEVAHDGDQFVCIVADYYTGRLVAVPLSSVLISKDENVRSD